MTSHPKRSQKGRTKRLSVALWMVALVTVMVSAVTQAQTYSVIHSFMGPDGSNPAAGITIDRGGNLYGTTSYGGNTSLCGGMGCGTVFKLSSKGQGWALTELHIFTGPDGAFPEARVDFGPDGILYGTTAANSGPHSYGTLFSLRPAASLCRSVSCAWNETVLFTFSFANGYDLTSDLAFDAAGNIYGTAAEGGKFQNCHGLGCGVIYEMTRSGGDWAQSILYNFTGGADGEAPYGVTLDPAGNLFGTAAADYYDGGTGGLAFEFTSSGGSWTETVLHYFVNSNDGSTPTTGLVLDSDGNLYGGTRFEGSGNYGTVFELSPSGDSWNFNVLYSLTGNGDSAGTTSLVMDSAGNLYGTTGSLGAYGLGNVFKLTYSNGSWTYTSLHDFSGGSDGAYPQAGLALDVNGNIYGTTSEGGGQGASCPNYNGVRQCGLVFEITP